MTPILTLLAGPTEEAIGKKLDRIRSAEPDAVEVAHLIQEAQHTVRAIITGGNHVPAPGNYLITTDGATITLYCHRDYYKILSEAIGLIGTSMKVNLDITCDGDACLMAMHVTVHTTTLTTVTAAAA